MDSLIRKVGGGSFMKMGFNIPGVEIKGCDDCILCINTSSEPMVLLSAVPYDDIDDEYFSYVDEYVSVRYFAIPHDVRDMLPYINSYLGISLRLDLTMSHDQLLASLYEDDELIYERDFDMRDETALVDGTDSLCGFLSAYCISVNNHLKV